MNRSNRGLSSLGCLSLNALAAAGLVALIVVMLGLTQGGAIFSPGALSAQAGAPALGGVASHAEITRCEQCHPAPFSGGSMAGACLACHTDLSQDPKNFHTLMVAEGQLSGCHTCHTEHRGAAAGLTQDNLAAFPHNQLGFSLQAHPKMVDGTPFLCSGCHPTTYVNFSPGVCASCHTLIQPEFMSGHTAIFGPDCRACHDGLDSYGHAFDHQQVRFALVGGHGTLTCDKCHTGARALADLKATDPACAACHGKDDSHQGSLGQDCAQCHTPVDWKKATIDHSLTAFPLVGKHQSVQCQDCHTNGAFKGTPQACAACHAKDDSHQGRLGQNCAQCHTPVDWKKATIDHSLTAFPLVGKHQGVQCQDCHTNSAYKDTPQACAACHAKDDAHKGQFGTECGACHTPTAWKPATFDHSKSIFPLTGAHLRLTCAKCHAPASGTGNMVFKGTPNACAGCHSDPNYHQGLFGSNCTSCHTTTAWTPAQFNLAHTFPIGHGRGGNTCHTCHPASLSQYTCYECHSAASLVKEHRNRGDISNCVKCHANGRGGD